MQYNSHGKIFLYYDNFINLPFSDPDDSILYLVLTIFRLPRNPVDPYPNNNDQNFKIGISIFDNNLLFLRKSGKIIFPFTK